MVNHFYSYCVDEDFGPFFLKFCSYFPYNAKLCINGNKYAKCQLRKRGIEFEALDNGVLSCADPKALQRICDGLDDKKMDRLLRKWLARLPHPFDRRDRRAGYTATACRSCRPSSRSRRCWTGRWPGGSSSSRSSARTWTSGDPARSNSSSIAG